MDLLITSPTGFSKERQYVCDVILKDWFGLDYRLVQSDRKDVCISLDEHSGEVCLPDSFFGQFESDANLWLDPKSLPVHALVSWDVAELSSLIAITSPILPVIYGSSQPTRSFSRNNSGAGNRIALPIDIFGSAFFMLSRYEEFATSVRDAHSRFSSDLSFALRAGVLMRPIVDEYVEVLWFALVEIWPQLKRKEHVSQTIVSCDVDRPFSHAGDLATSMRRIGGDILKRKSLVDAYESIAGSLRFRKRDYRGDKFRDAISKIMDLNERAGRSVAFNVIPEVSHSKYDQATNLRHPGMRALLSEIKERGHEVGIHPGYGTCDNEDAMASSFDVLRGELELAGMPSLTLGGRQHYLRWNERVTPILLEKNGMSYDSTLGFADRPGFRCGTCREFSLFDMKSRRALSLRERPLIVMECSVISRNYMGLGYTDEALEVMLGLKEACELMSGNFVLLWHNSHLTSADDLSFYTKLVA
ncbi:polysaccharide deacetylase family protein [Congregibacter brevis]|uniref:Polysaccharide deacetylase family protein n=1 Tax=Congregibacter brevis TaxID=3081201 RepID=A0ABZ0IBN3_9GAMM|nr:polysaccharide deacetylase family protein [Congregibacter sp. IMCC45268]